MGDAARRWAELQSGRGIPPEILAAAPASPWTHNPVDFTAPETPADTPSRDAALALLGDGGTVLDVGCGGGDATFALVGPLRAATGVDQQQDMLDLFTTGAAARGIAAGTVQGKWPDVASGVDGLHDVVVSHHVLHNVVDLPPFLDALTAGAARGVVVEMLPQHPMAWLDPLWERFHDLHRPPSATDADAVAVLAELGITPEVRRFVRERRHPHDPAWVTRRLCLPDERTPEVEAAMAGVPLRDPDAVTLTWTV
ncbi:class I SAM-dependent methyltransferase [Pseudonocardia endophytica]|uniref:Methyltransferase family protein n=1 Tax=Pseudonocardia endophytica TaxID=401976 RepID=A0A4R1I4R7_PSEEN|nr:class I SAM-dependent methyltransferase [Pseudonocardia endophytica]TCK25022.1 methyltransferase family protein [Pseudonocardia endophytica]